MSCFKTSQIGADDESTACSTPSNASQGTRAAASPASTAALARASRIPPSLTFATNLNIAPRRVAQRNISSHASSRAAFVVDAAPASPDNARVASILSVSSAISAARRPSSPIADPAIASASARIASAYAAVSRPGDARASSVASPGSTPSRVLANASSAARSARVASSIVAPRCSRAPPALAHRAIVINARTFSAIHRSPSSLELARASSRASNVTAFVASVARASSSANASSTPTAISHATGIGASRVVRRVPVASRARRGGPPRARAAVRRRAAVASAGRRRARPATFRLPATME